METLIGLFVTFFTTAFGAIIAHFATRYNFNMPKKYSISEIQLKQALSPINSVLSINAGLSEEQKYQKIDEIIKKNYLLVHPEICELFYNKNMDEFKKQISDCYSYARDKMGYAQFKPKKYNAKTKSLVATNSRQVQIMSGIICFMSIAIIYMGFSLYYNKVGISGKSQFEAAYNNPGRGDLFQNKVAVTANYQRQDDGNYAVTVVASGGSGSGCYAIGYGKSLDSLEYFIPVDNNNNPLTGYEFTGITPGSTFYFGAFKQGDDVYRDSLADVIPLSTPTESYLPPSENP